MMNDETIYALLKERNSRALMGHIKEDPSLLHFTDRRGISLLQLSSYFGLDELRDYILERRDPADIFEAASAGAEASVSGFLSNDPSLLNAYSPDGFTPLGFAAYFRHPAVVYLLLRKGADCNLHSKNAFLVAPLHSAVAANSEEICTLLLMHGANPNARQQKNIAPIHSAAHNGNTVITRLLLKYGADASARCGDGKTPLDYAREAGAGEVEAILAAVH